jgi:hypothetical protein
MTKSKRIAQKQVINNQNEEVMSTVENQVEEVVNTNEPEIVVVPEVTETLAEKIIRIKAEQAAQLAALVEQKKALDDQVKAMKAEEAALKLAQKEELAKDRFSKLQMLLANPVLSKRDQVAEAIILGAKTPEQVEIITGFDAKFISDTIWGLEKSVGLR